MNISFIKSSIILSLVIFLVGPVYGQMCINNFECAPGFYCEKYAGDCAWPGMCMPRPEICTTLWAPVCGCDGMTYGNACEAAAAGVSVSYGGECVPSSPCTSSATCGAGYYCDKAYGDCNGQGMCEPVPTEECPQTFAPVCGCDGVTYAGECEAAKALTSVAHVTACLPPDCLDNGDCSVVDFCRKADGDCGGSGVCEAIPTACPDIWDPVCGCDGMTYGNDCESAAAGVSVAYTGECSSPACSDNGECSAGEYCQKVNGDCGGTGACAEMPTGCLAVWDPVCGCDDVTYGNDCEAAAAGVNAAYNGECAVCVNQPLADISGDCRVSLLDLAMVAAEWLDCGLDRPEICWQ